MKAFLARADPLKLINGRALANQTLEQLAQRVRDLQPRALHKPSLAYVMVGDNADSQAYVRIKTRACRRLGIAVVPNHFPGSVSAAEVLHCIDSLNKDETVHGLLVQLPLPKHLDTTTVLDAVWPSKDLDCLSSTNFGKLSMRGSQPAFWPCTPQGCMELLDHAGISVAGKHAVVVGRSNLAGRPLAAMLQQANATVTLCHAYTPNLRQYTRQADILCVAAGIPDLITADMVKEKAVVLDIGINVTPTGLVGDVDFDGLLEKVAAITPVPGGVGPMTVAMLLTNLVSAWEKRIPSEHTRA